MTKRKPRKEFREEVIDACEKYSNYTEFKDNVKTLDNFDEYILVREMEKKIRKEFNANYLAEKTVFTNKEGKIEAENMCVYLLGQHQEFGEYYRGLVELKFSELFDSGWVNYSGSQIHPIYELSELDELLELDETENKLDVTIPPSVKQNPQTESDKGYIVANNI